MSIFENLYNPKPKKTGVDSGTIESAPAPAAPLGAVEALRVKNPGRDLLFEAAMMLGFWPDGVMEPYDKTDAADLRRKIHEHLRVTNPLSTLPAPPAPNGQE